MLCVCDWEHFSSRLWVISYYIPYFFSFWVSPRCLSYANCKHRPPRLTHGFASQLLYRLVQHRRATQPPPVQLQHKPWPLTPASLLLLLLAASCESSKCQRRTFWIQCLRSECLYFYTCLLRVCAVLLFLLNRVPWWQPGQTLSLSCKVAGYSLDKLLFSYTLDTAASRKSTGVDIRHRLWWGHISSASPETPPVTQ